MTRKMYDSVTAANIPAGAPMVAGYVDGLYRNVDEMRARFPKAPLVTITVNGRNKANIVDIERGDCTPQSGVASVKAGIAAGCYMSASVVADVCAQIDAQGVPRDTPLWTAHYTGTPHLCDTSCTGPLPFTPNIVATQYAGDVPPGIDISLVADYWPGVDPVRPEGDEVTPDECRKIVREELTYALGALLKGENSIYNLPGDHATLDGVAGDVAAVKKKVGA